MKAKDQKRTPLPGSEVEYEVVSLAATAKLELLDSHLAENAILEALTKPGRPGLFSDALHKQIARTAEVAVEALGLLRRLRVLCGETPARLELLDLHQPGETDAGKKLRWEFDGLTDEEAEAAVQAARHASWKALETRKLLARRDDRCPKCGGVTSSCALEGRWLTRKELKETHPARRCWDCHAVTPNALHETATVVQLIPLPADAWRN